jgi:RND family efflux transporter MFP subunit
MHTRLIVPALAPFLAAALLAACGSASGRAATEDGDLPAPVRVAPVSRESLAPPIVATGTLGAKEEITLGFKIGGVADRILVDPGARVGAGDTLAVLDLREIDAAVARARSAAEKTARDLARAHRLYADSVVALAQLQDAETANAVARADLEAARFNRRYAIIVAPAAGVILRRMAEPGELVAAAAPVLVLGSMARGMVLRVGLTDRDVVRVRRGDAATVRFEAIADRELAGAVSEIAAAADPMTGTYTVDVRLPTAVTLATGLVGRAEIRPSSAGQVTLVPIEALIEADDTVGTVFVLSADGARAERRRVSIGFLAGDRIAVSGGLEGASRVITDGATYLADGQSVRVRP